MDWFLGDLSQDQTAQLDVALNQCIGPAAGK